MFVLWFKPYIWMYAHIIDKQRFDPHKLQRYITIYTYMHKWMYWKECRKSYFKNNINRLLSNPWHHISFTKYISVLSMAIPVQQSRKVNILLTESQIFWCYHQTLLNVVGIHKYLNNIWNNSIVVFIILNDSVTLQCLKMNFNETLSIITWIW